MSKPLHQRLGQLCELRTQSRERAQARLAEQQRLCERMAGTVQRLEALAAGAAPAEGRLDAALLANQGAYKDAVLDLARGQRQALAQGRAEAQAAQAALVEQLRGEAALQQFRSQVGGRLAQDARRQEQKTQDAVAAQAWQRGARS
jgi:flagellar export protein FliJ